MMKKTLWMMAAILFFSLSSTMLTACSDDDDDPKDEGKGNVEVRVAVVTQRDTYKMFTFDFTLTGPDGKTNTYKFDSSDKNDDKFYEAEANTFQVACMPYLFYPGATSFFENVVMHHYVFKNVPNGAKIDYKTVSHLVRSFQPEEKGNKFLMATVMVTYVTADGQVHPLKPFDFNFGIYDKAMWEKNIEKYDNYTVPQSTNSVTVVYPTN